nr:hypothetical protein [[Eubacterium] tenue]
MSIKKIIKILKNSKFVFLTGILSQFITIYLYISPTPVNTINNKSYIENKTYININIVHNNYIENRRN